MSTTVLNPVYVTDSLSEICDLPKDIQWLAIAPKEQPELVETLIESFAGKSAWILTLDESTYDTASPSLQSAVQQTVTSGSVKHVVLVSSTSRGHEPIEDEATLPEDVNGVASRLMAGVASQSALNRQAKEIFKQEFEQFSNSAPIQMLRDSGSISVSGLLYRDCDAVFLLLDPDTGKFMPLAAEI